MITSHPSQEALLDYAAGRLSAGPQFVLATHLSLCPQCREQVWDYEAVGGALLASENGVRLSHDAFARTLAMIDSPVPEARVPRHKPRSPGMPGPLARYETGRWRFIHPRLRWQRIVLPQDPKANVIMLKVSAGQPVPHHGHTGREFTQVIAGGFSDVTGHYLPGDFIEADATLSHQPVADRDGDCIVLASVEGSLRLGSWLGRLAQPLIGL